MAEHYQNVNDLLCILHYRLLLTLKSNTQADYLILCLGFLPYIFKALIHAHTCISTCSTTFLFVSVCVCARDYFLTYFPSFHFSLSMSMDFAVNVRCRCIVNIFISECCIKSDILRRNIIYFCYIK